MSPEQINQPQYEQFTSLLLTMNTTSTMNKNDSETFLCKLFFFSSAVYLWSM